MIPGTPSPKSAWTARSSPIISSTCRSEELVCNLRTAVGADGKRLFVGFASGQQRLHLYDENWKLLVNYPEDALRNRHAGICDVELADLDGDGTLRLYVGYWGDVGVQAASLEGKRLASNRLINEFVHLAVGPIHEKAIAT